MPFEGVPPAGSPVLHGRVGAVGPGKESTTGHWELMGVRVERALPTYPEGFPAEVVAALERATGQRFCCNRPFSGTAVLDAFGEHHLATGELILYTSADSVLQIAAHIDVLSEPELYDVCEAAREVMYGEHAVGRVIARPFDGAAGAWHRREGRRDFALPPPSRSYLQELQAAPGYRCTASARSATCSPGSASTSSTRARRTPRGSPRPPRCCASWTRGSSS